MILGIDEVGRGCWAGPMAVAAVGLGGAEIDGLTDSKLLSRKKRERLSLEIKQSAPLVGIGWVSARDIDTIGLSAALTLAARRAVSQIDLEQVDQIIIDGTINLFRNYPELSDKVTLMKKADLLIPSVSAASIVAKVARDHYMYLCDEVFPGYGFAGHVGYGAEKHKLALDQLGVSAIHRMSFAPMKFMAPLAASAHLNGAKNSSTLSHMKNIASSLLCKKDDMKNNATIGASKNIHITKNDNKLPKKDTTRVGLRAEQATVEYLNRHGYQVIDQNWKTKWCEVDIIALRQEVVYFVEVKYRRSVRQGGGIAAITPRKLRQMRFAAELWLQDHPDTDARLSVAEVTGENLDVVRLIENV